MVPTTPVNPSGHRTQANPIHEQNINISPRLIMSSGFQQTILSIVFLNVIPDPQVNMPDGPRPLNGSDPPS